MTTLSKLAYSLGLRPLTTNCYETIHTWEPDCTRAITVAIPEGVLFSLKTYASFYLVATLLAKRDPRKVDWKRYIRDVIQSSAFLSTNLILFLYFFCRIRHGLGFFVIPTIGGLSSFLASFVAILIEKKNRRPALALYLMNLASETMYRQLVNHGYMIRFPKGECVPFAAGLVMFMYLYSKGRLSPSLKKFMNFTHMIEPMPDIINLKVLPDEFHAMLHKLRTDYSKGAACEHAHSCASLAVESFTKNFGVGLGISSALYLARNLKKVFTSPLKVFKALTSAGTLKIPLFFGLMPLLFHSTRCALNRVPQLSPTTRNTSAAAVSALSMATFPNVTIAMYTLWKGIEAIYNDGVERGTLPVVPHADIMLYTLSTGYVLWQACIEPHAIRKGYQNFLMGLTGGRLRLFNRTLYDYYGYESSKIWPYIPKLDTRFTTLNPQLYQHVCCH